METKNTHRYPQLSKGLGRALGEAKFSGRVAGAAATSRGINCTREFEGASVHVNFLDFRSARIQWKSINK